MVRISGSTFLGNSGTRGDSNGGGIYFNQVSEFQLLESRFEGNSVMQDGGAVLFLQSDGLVSDCVFTGNAAGAFVVREGSNMQMERVEIVNNVGGGLVCLDTVAGSRSVISTTNEYVIRGNAGGDADLRHVMLVCVHLCRRLIRIPMMVLEYVCLLVKSTLMHVTDVCWCRVC